MTKTNEKVRYDPDGNKIQMHDHKWVQSQVALHPTPLGGIYSASVGWRCTRRSGEAIRVQVYKFRRPRADQAPNTFSDEVMTWITNTGSRPW